MADTPDIWANVEVDGMREALRELITAWAELSDRLAVTYPEMSRTERAKIVARIINKSLGLPPAPVLAAGVMEDRTK